MGTLPLLVIYNQRHISLIIECSGTNLTGGVNTS